MATGHPFFAGNTDSRLRIFAHRGFVSPEANSQVFDNTRQAFMAAEQLGVTYVETDCHLTADGEVVLFHDAHTTRLNGQKTPVAKLTRAELEALLAERGGLLTLSEALQEFSNLRFNLDVKAAAAAEPAGVIASRHADRVLLTSFADSRREQALAAATNSPGGGRPATSAGYSTIAKVLFMLASRRHRELAALLAELDALQIPQKYGPLRVLSESLIARARDSGTEVHVWTINEPSQMQTLLDLGVSGIVTDRADLALAVAQNSRARDV